MTPDYLRFLEEEPKETPVGAAITGAMQAYGDVQKLRQQTMLTEAMPKKLAAEQEIQKQTIEKGKLEAQYAPTELQQQQQQRESALKQQQMITDALPDKLKAELTGDQLRNVVMQYQSQVGKIGAQQAGENYVNGRLSELYGQATQGLPSDVINKKYQTILQHGKAMGADISSLPATWNKDAQTQAAYQYAQSPASLKAQETHNELLKAAIVAKLKAAGKSTTGAATPPYQTAYDKKQGEIDAGYNDKVTDSATRGVQMYKYAKEIESLANAHPIDFGAVVGSTTSRWNTPAQEAFSNAVNILLDRMQNFPATALRTQAMQELFKQAKINPAKDTWQTLLHKTKQIETESLGRSEEAEFNQFMNNLGVSNKSEKDLSWNRFLASNPERMPDGSLNPENIRNWRQWFDKHKEALPTPLRVKIDLQDTIAKSSNTAIAQPISVPTQPQVTSTGVIPQYNPQQDVTHKNLLNNLLTGTPMWR